MPDASSHDSFVAWASARGVRVNGIAPAAFAGRRLGLRAQRELKVCALRRVLHQSLMSLRLRSWIALPKSSLHCHSP